MEEDVGASAKSPFRTFLFPVRRERTAAGRGRDRSTWQSGCPLSGRDMQGRAVGGNLWKVNIYSFRIDSAEITDLFGADWKIILLRMKNRSPENDFRFCGTM